MTPMGSNQDRMRVCMCVRVLCCVVCVCVCMYVIDNNDVANYKQYLIMDSHSKFLLFVLLEYQ